MDAPLFESTASDWFFESTDAVRLLDPARVKLHRRSACCWAFLPAFFSSSICLLTFSACVKTSSWKVEKIVFSRSLSSFNFFVFGPFVISRLVSKPHSTLC